jgi:hypothetical protein
MKGELHCSSLMRAIRVTLVGSLVGGGQIRREEPVLR